VTLGVLAGLTAGSDLRLGTLVTPVTYRAPGLLAKMVGDARRVEQRAGVLRAGRGLGGSASTPDSGLPFPPAGQRLDQLELTIGIERPGPG